MFLLLCSPSFDASIPTPYPTVGPAGWVHSVFPSRLPTRAGLTWPPWLGWSWHCRTSGLSASQLNIWELGQLFWSCKNSSTILHGERAHLPLFEIWLSYCVPVGHSLYTHSSRGWVWLERLCPDVLLTGKPLCKGYKPNVVSLIFRLSHLFDS